MVMERPKSVATYFKKLPPEQREPLQKLRDTIAAAAPEAEEGITYSMPGFLLGGKGFVAYAAFKDHYSFFPMGTSAIEDYKEQLGEHLTGKGTISFRYGERLPAALVKKIVRTRLAEARAREARRR
jgi:uncharacterized protein YdhG (YjbR/CyaY superfamily)